MFRRAISSSSSRVAPLDGTRTRTNSISSLPGGRSRTTGNSLGTAPPLRRQMTKSLCLVSSCSLRLSADRLCSSNVKYLQVPSSKSSTAPSSLAVLWKMVRRAGMCRGSSIDGGSSTLVLDSWKKNHNEFLLSIGYELIKTIKLI